jgi:hypothetical protein
LLQLETGSTLAEASTRLGVSEYALRTTADRLAPHPLVDVLVAAIRVYGVDPGWLLTGTYSVSSHSQALAADAEHDIERLRLLVTRVSVFGNQSVLPVPDGLPHVHVSENPARDGLTESLPAASTRNDL